MALYSPSQKICFVHIYKTGGMSVRKVMHSLFPDYVEVGEHHCTALEARIALLEKFPLVNDSAVSFFAFVRNPFSWMVSLYSFSRQTKDHPDYQFCQNNSFENYVRYFIEKMHAGSRNGNGQYSTQSSFLKDRYGNIDSRICIGSQENFEVDLFSFLNGVDCKIDYYKIFFPFENVSDHMTKIDQYYSETTIALMQKHFQEDFFNFHYEPYPPTSQYK